MDKIIYIKQKLSQERSYFPETVLIIFKKTVNELLMFNNIESTLRLCKYIKLKSENSSLQIDTI